MVRGRKIGRREFLKRGAAAIAGLALPPVRSVRVVPPPTHQDVWKIEGEHIRADAFDRVLSNHGSADSDWSKMMSRVTVWHVTNWRDGWIGIGSSDA